MVGDVRGGILRNIGKEDLIFPFLYDLTQLNVLVWINIISVLYFQIIVEILGDVLRFPMIFFQAEDISESVFNTIHEDSRYLTEFGSDIDDIELNSSLMIFVGFFNILEETIEAISL